ncbi:MAG: glycosyltransferase family 39 protein [Candidatus Latescibacteria bacterium]|nr:glycosyltransferase family 39 protein [Candidatus Latescibacterota bacterium]
MGKDSKKKIFKSEKTSRGKHCNYIIPGVFIIIALVYSVSLIVLFPALPVTTRDADIIPGYDTYYPPFRTDEYNYYSIAQNILNGRLYEKDSYERAYPLGYPLAAAPFIALFGTMGGYIANVVIVLFSILFFYLLIRRFYDRNHTLIFVFIMAFATLNWFYAVSCYSEPLSQLLIILSLYLITKGKESRGKPYVLLAAGLITGLNLFVRPHYILLTVPFFISLWITNKTKFSFEKNNGVPYATGVGIVVIIWLIRNTVVFGSPLIFEYTRMLAQFLPGTRAVGVKGHVLFGTHRLLFDEFHGLLTITPIVLLFPAGLRAMWQRGMKNEAITFLVSVILMMLVFGAGPYPFTEFGLGSRHMMPIFPLLMIPVAFFFDGKLFSRMIIFILALYSLYHAGIGWFTGTYPGFGYFPGFLNDSFARAIILARKGALPKRTFKSSDDLIRTHMKGLDKADLYTFLQTLAPETLKLIKGNERNFFMYWRQHQQDIREKIQTMDPQIGITYEGFRFVNPQIPAQPGGDNPPEENQ